MSVVNSVPVIEYLLGRIIFAWKQGTDLDCNAKTWRLIADVLNDIGMILEMVYTWSVGC